MNKYIHLGFPKNLSTTLQRDFFPKHSEIFHLGVGIKSNIDYVDDKINIACEDYLLYANERKYKRVKNEVIDTFHNWFKKAEENPKKKTVGISAELLSFAFTPDHVDLQIKAQRLFEIFGKDTKIIMLIRNQKDLLKSLYKEAIKIGYSKSYREFIEYCYYFHDRNFIFDFCYDETIELYADLFGAANVIAIPVEKVRDVKSGELIVKNDKNLLVNELCNGLNIGYEPMTLNHYNEPLSAKGLYAMMERNKKHNHNLSNDVYSAVNGHRLAKYFNVDLNIPLPDLLAKDVIAKRNAIDHSFIVEKQAESREIDFFCDDFIWNKLMGIYEESNSKLKKYIPDLPDEYAALKK